MKCENGDLRTQLENSKKRKERNTSRRMAWLITNQSPRSRYEQEKAEQEAKKQEQEQRRQEKEAWDIEEAAYIAREAADRVFGSFASYKVRCALIILARALGLSAEGTNIVLTAQISLKAVSCSSETTSSARGINWRLYDDIVMSPKTPSSSRMRLTRVEVRGTKKRV